MAQTAQAVALFHDKKGRAKDYPVALLPLIDTHGHLTDFDENTPTRALARAAQAGVCHLVSPVDPADDATDPRHLMYAFHMWCKDAHTLIDAQRQAGVSFPKFEGQEAHGRTADAAEIAHFVRIVAGVHPYGAKAYLEDPEVKKHLIFILRCPVCVGVGEIGLDYTAVWITRSRDALLLNSSISRRTGVCPSSCTSEMHGQTVPPRHTAMR